MKKENKKLKICTAVSALMTLVLTFTMVYLEYGIPWGNDPFDTFGLEFVWIFMALCFIFIALIAFVWWKYITGKIETTLAKALGCAAISVGALCIIAWWGVCVNAVIHILT